MDMKILQMLIWEDICKIWLLEGLTDISHDYNVALSVSLKATEWTVSVNIEDFMYFKKDKSNYFAPKFVRLFAMSGTAAQKRLKMNISVA